MSDRGHQRDYPLPLTLAIETAGSLCSAAIARGDELLAAESRPLRHGHAEAVLPMIGRVAAAAGIVPRDLDVVAVATGPGGFTGIRVGLAAAHGVALAVEASLIGITSFEAVAARFSTVATADAPVLLVALDSRRAELYVQLFSVGAGLPIGDAAAVPADKLMDHVAGAAGGASLAVAGDAAEVAARALESGPVTRVIRDSAPNALGVLWAARRCSANDRSAAVARPFYLRPADVTLPKRPNSRATPQP